MVGFVFSDRKHRKANVAFTVHPSPVESKHHHS